MRPSSIAALGVLLAAGLGFGQQAAPPASPPPSVPPADQTVYYAGPGVTAPELLQTPIEVSKPRHCNKLNGIVKLAAVIDANGIPRDVKSVQENNALLGNFAVSLVEAERFKPGSYNGAASPVAIEITLGLQTCMRHDESQGSELALKAHPTQSLTLRTAWNSGDSSPLSKIGGQISAPVPLSTPGPRYSAYGRKERLQGTCLIDLIVDTNGVPQKVHIVKSLEPSLDQKAIEAVKSWHFKPALKDGTTPVPVEITVEVSFHLF